MAARTEAAKPYCASPVHRHLTEHIVDQVVAFTMHAFLTLHSCVSKSYSFHVAAVIVHMFLRCRVFCAKAYSHPQFKTLAAYPAATARGEALELLIAQGSATHHSLPAYDCLVAFNLVLGELNSAAVGSHAAHTVGSTMATGTQPRPSMLQVLVAWLFLGSVERSK
eukprot:355915-Chlamydomonas_euryale.AAC.13